MYVSQLGLQLSSSGNRKLYSFKNILVIFLFFFKRCDNFKQKFLLNEVICQSVRFATFQRRRQRKMITATTFLQWLISNQAMLTFYFVIFLIIFLFFKRGKVCLLFLFFYEVMATTLLQWLMMSPSYVDFFLFLFLNEDFLYLH